MPIINIPWNTPSWGKPEDVLRGIAHVLLSLLLVSCRTSDYLKNASLDCPWELVLKAVDWLPHKLPPTQTPTPAESLPFSCPGLDSLCWCLLFSQLPKMPHLGAGNCCWLYVQFPSWLLYFPVPCEPCRQASAPCRAPAVPFCVKFLWNSSKAMLPKG